MTRLTVRKAYLFNGNTSRRVIADNNGRVYEPQTGWVHPDGTVHAQGVVYERWSDVPAAWLGHVPFWK